MTVKINKKDKWYNPDFVSVNKLLWLFYYEMREVDRVCIAEIFIDSILMTSSKRVCPAVDCLRLLYLYLKVYIVI